MAGHLGWRQPRGKDMTTTEIVDIRRAAARAATKISWLDSKHSFSFGANYQPDNTHHGLLLVNNDDVVKPGRGFDTHPHRDMEIVTWVLRGSLVHQDSTIACPPAAASCTPRRTTPGHSPATKVTKNRCISCRCG